MKEGRRSRPTVVRTIVVAPCLIRAPMAMPVRAHTGASTADAAITRRAPGWLIDRPTPRPDRIARVAVKDATATTAPYTVMTAVTTVTFAAIRARRSGTAANVVRIRPVEYSPTTVTAPMLDAARISIIAAPSVKASKSAVPVKWARIIAL